MTPILEEVAELVGTEAAEWLREKYPGQRIWVPSEIDSSHKLAGIGPEAAKKLSYYYGGCRFRIPSEKYQSMQQRTQRRGLEIWTDWARGMPTRLLEEKYSLSRTSICKHLRRYRRQLEEAEC